MHALTMTAPTLAQSLVLAGIAVAILLVAFIAELLEQADIGRDIDDEGGGK